MFSPATQDFTRDELRQFLPTDQAIKKFERILRDLRINMPTNIAELLALIDEIQVASDSGFSIAQNAIAVVEVLRDQVALLVQAPRLEADLESLRGKVAELAQAPAVEAIPQTRDYSFTYLHMGA